VCSHRDGHFRRLKDIRVGDEILVDTPSHRYRYVVAEIRVTDPAPFMGLIGAVLLGTAAALRGRRLRSH
jgi:sortase (surface protein transpeptidase)